MVVTVSKVYASVNDRKPKSYWDYENATLLWNSIDPYEIVSKIGQGKYSDVFKGVDTKTNELCVIKVLKPVRSSKFNRYKMS